jgi:hypothetical protein
MTSLVILSTWSKIFLFFFHSHNLDHPVFEGAFSVYGDTHHVKLKDNYQLTKRSDDAELTSNLNSHMVIYRDSDTITKRSHESSLSSGGGECGFDRITPISKRAYDPLAMVDHSPFAVRRNFEFGKTLSKRAPAGCPTSKKGNVF